MKHPPSSRAWHHPVAIILALLLLLSNAALAGAQGVAPPVLRITKVDVSQFPDVKLYVYGQNLGQNLAEVPLVVKQDGAEQAVTASEMADVGAQVALLVDASLDIRKPGVTGDPRYIEVSNVVTRMVERGVFAPQTDWIAAYAPAADDTIQAIKDWTRDHGGLRNDMYVYEPPKDIKETPLFELIYKGLDAFADPKLDPSAQRVVVLFSDGLDTVSGVNLDDAIARANEMDVAIHTVLLGAGTKDGRGNLERIALKTGGEFVPLSTIDAVDPVWDKIAGGRQQRVLGYRSRSVEPREVAVIAQLTEGAVTATSPIQAVGMEPVQVQIQQPTPGLEIIRSGNAYTTPLSALTPAVLPIQLAFSWPDGRSRGFKSVEYTIDNDTRTVTAEPFDRIDFPIDTLGEGNHTLRVQAIDEFGITSQAQPQVVTVRIDKPGPPPTPTPPPLPPVGDVNGDGTVNVIDQLMANWLTIAALALALIALLVAIVVLLRKPEVRVRATEALTGTIKAVTQPFSLDRKMRGQEAARARLVLVEGNANVPPVVELRGSNTASRP